MYGFVLASIHSHAGHTSWVGDSNLCISLRGRNRINFEGGLEAGVERNGKNGEDEGRECGERRLEMGNIGRGWKPSTVKTSWNL